VRRRRRKTALYLSTLCIVCVCCIGIYKLYDDFVKNDTVIKNNKEVDNNYEDNEKVINEDSEDNVFSNDELSNIEPIASSNNSEDIVSVDTIDEPKILSSTRIEYQNYYTLDDKLEVQNDVEPPYYMLNLTREQVEEFYPDQQLMAFSSDKVILRKIIEDYSPNYKIIKSYKGSVCLFHDYTKKDNANLDEYLIETTKIPVDELVQEEQEKLYDGIVVHGDQVQDILDRIGEVYYLNRSGNYILREYRGMLGIFYDYRQVQDYKEELEKDMPDEFLTKYLRRVIETPVIGLEEELKDKLKEGIVVNGEEDLIRLLENYTS
jgi:hypothetical protein